MSFERIAAVGTFAAEMGNAIHRPVHVLWHGGEPLMLGADFFREAGDILDAALPGHGESIQTSLIPFREEHVPIVLERFDGGIGSSIDFSQRKLNGSVEAYHDLWMKKVGLARVNGIVVIPGVVPTRNEIGREAEIVTWMVDRGFEAFNIDRYNAYNTAFPDRPSNREHAVLLGALFDALMEREREGRPAPIVGAVRASITGVLFGVGGDRWGGTCTSDFVVVEPDGSLNNCPDKSTVDVSFGRVEDGYRAFALNRFRRKSIRHHTVDHKMGYCATCENAHFCKSGCPITPNGPQEDPVEQECSGYWTYLDHVRKYAASPGGRETMLSYLKRRVESPVVDVYSQAPDGRGACAA